MIMPEEQIIFYDIVITVIHFTKLVCIGLLKAVGQIVSHMTI